jgi:predicted metal-dependent hydrolase
MSEEYPAQYLEGLRLFNAEDFFESHEVLEDLWSDTHDERRKFYQGLIQAAVALLHFGNGNLGGAKKVYLSSRKYLDAYRPQFEGLDIDRLLADLQFCFQELVDNQQSYPAGIELQDDRVPKIPLPGGMKQS